MTYNEFWSRYHREDPDEANAHPHRLRIYLANGKKRDVLFPGTATVTETTLAVGVGRGKSGFSKSFEYHNWKDVIKIEELRGRELAGSGKT